MGKMHSYALFLIRTFCCYRFQFSCNVITWQRQCSQRWNEKSFNRVYHLHRHEDGTVTPACMLWEWKKSGNSILIKFSSHILHCGNVQPEQLSICRGKKVTKIWTRIYVKRRERKHSKLSIGSHHSSPSSLFQSLIFTDDTSNPYWLAGKSKKV